MTVVIWSPVICFANRDKEQLNAIFFIVKADLCSKIYFFVIITMATLSLISQKIEKNGGNFYFHYKGSKSKMASKMAASFYKKMQMLFRKLRAVLLLMDQNY